MFFNVFCLQINVFNIYELNPRPRDRKSVTPRSQFTQVHREAVILSGRLKLQSLANEWQVAET